MIIITICAIFCTFSLIIQAVLLFGLVNHIRHIKEERLLVQQLVSNERWI
jgi:hypothetical protein